MEDSILNLNEKKSFLEKTHSTQNIENKIEYDKKIN